MLHKVIFFLVLTLILAFGCTPPDTEAISKINDLKMRIEAGDSEKRTAAELINAYVEYANKHPEDKERSATFLYEAAGLQYRSNNMQQCLQNLDEVLTKFPGSKAEANSLALKGTLLAESNGKFEDAKRVFHTLLDKYPKHPQAEMAKEYFLPPQEQLTARIVRKEKQVYEGDKQMRNKRQLFDLMALYKAHALKYDTDSMSFHYLIKAGDLARVINDPKNAVELYTSAFDNFENHPKRGEALFMKAFVIDEFYKQDEAQIAEAKKLYQQFIRQFPKHDLADDAQASLDFLGKSNEEIIKMLEKKSRTN